MQEHAIALTMRLDIVHSTSSFAYYSSFFHTN